MLEGLGMVGREEGCDGRVQFCICFLGFRGESIFVIFYYIIWVLVGKVVRELQYRFQGVFCVYSVLSKVFWVGITVGVALDREYGFLLYILRFEISQYREVQIQQQLYGGQRISWFTGFFLVRSLFLRFGVVVQLGSVRLIWFVEEKVMRGKESQCEGIERVFFFISY